MESYSHEEFINAMKMQGKEPVVTYESLERENKKRQEREEILKQRGHGDDGSAGAKWEGQRELDDIEREKKIRQENKDKLRKIQAEVGDGSDARDKFRSEEQQQEGEQEGGAPPATKENSPKKEEAAAEIVATGDVSKTVKSKQPEQEGASDVEGGQPVVEKDEKSDELSPTRESAKLEKNASSSENVKKQHEEKAEQGDAKPEEQTTAKASGKQDASELDEKSDGKSEQPTEEQETKEEPEKIYPQKEGVEEETDERSDSLPPIPSSKVRAASDAATKSEEYKEVDPTKLPPLLRGQFAQGGGPEATTEGGTDSGQAPVAYNPNSVVKARTDVPYSLTSKEDNQHEDGDNKNKSSTTTASSSSTTSCGIIVSLHWVGRIDLDLSAVILNPAGKVYANFFFGETPFSGTMVHSGDMLHGPAPLGAVEQITIKSLDSLPLSAVSTIYFIMSNFSGESTVDALQSVEAHVALTTTTTTPVLAPVVGVAAGSKKSNSSSSDPEQESTLSAGGSSSVIGPKNLTTKRTHPLASFDAFRNAGHRATALCRVFRNKLTPMSNQTSPTGWSIEYLQDLNFSKGETVMELGKDIQQHLVQHPTK